MSELQQNRYDQLLRRVGDLKGPGSKVNDVLTELFPVLEVERAPIELMLFTGWRHGMGSTSNPSLALNFVVAELLNPPGSGLISVPTRVDVWSSITQNIGYALTTFVAATRGGPEEQRDARSGVSAATTSELRTGVQLTVPNISGLLGVIANQTFTLQDDNGLFVLAPGTGVIFFTTTVDTDFNTGWLWRERVAQPSELNL